MSDLIERKPDFIRVTVAISDLMKLIEDHEKSDLCMKVYCDGKRKTEFNIVTRVTIEEQ